MLTPAARHRAGAEHGFTLIETLVAMATGIVIAAVLFTVLEVSVKQSTRLADAATATQLGRVAMNHVVDELHSACLSQGFSPVQEKSTENKLIVANGYGEGAEVPSVGTSSTGVRKDEIVYSPAAETLIDYTYYATGETNGEYTWGTVNPGVRIGEHITRTSENGKLLPIFGYYAYATTPATSTTAAGSELNETTPLGGSGEMTKAVAETVASVVVSFATAPPDYANLDPSEKKQGRIAPLTSQVVFSFESPPNESTTKDEPCAS
jgi:type II secretory pathway pseudopilin PulG